MIDFSQVQKTSKNAKSSFYLPPSIVFSKGIVSFDCFGLSINILNFMVIDFLKDSLFKSSGEGFSGGGGSCA